MKKQIVLLLTLAIPVALFLFLKMFGENEYEVPVMLERGIDGCSDVAQPHIVNLDSMKISPPSHCVVVVMDSVNTTVNQALITELVRIQDAFYGRVEPQFILMTDAQSTETRETLQDLCEKIGLNPAYTNIPAFNIAEYRDFMECGLGLGKPEGGKLTDLTLIDEEGRIRGYYPRNEKEETDRLILELKILKNQK